jgi:regulator of CtrA degradation
MKTAEKGGNAATFVQSELFARTFRQGMSLVEETANYLDGPGREASRNLSRSAALAYAGASMRLTTQLMQIASWLLVMRAVREGEMALDEARDEKYRVKPREHSLGDLHEEGLPEALIRLATDSVQLYARIARLDADIFTLAKSSPKERDAAAQQRALLDAFGAGRRAPIS